MANEEIRGEVQDPRLIGASAPGSTLGLAGAVPGMGGLTPVAPPYVGGAQKVFETLPINGKRFVYDNLYFVAANTDNTPATLTAVLPLLGPNAPYISTEFSVGGVLVPGVAIGSPLYGSYITLVTGFSWQLFVNQVPMPSIPPLFPVNDKVRLDRSGSVLYEYDFNFADTNGIRPVFIPMNTTDTLSVMCTVVFGNVNFPALPATFSMEARVVLEGVLIPDNGSPKELQVSL